MRSSFLGIGSSRASNNNFDLGNLAPKQPKPATTDALTTALNQGLATLAQLRPFGNGTKTAYPADCCGHDEHGTPPAESSSKGKRRADATPAAAATANKSQPLSKEERKSIEAFAKDIRSLIKDKTPSRWRLGKSSSSSTPRLGFLERALGNADVILNRDHSDPLAPHDIKHDLNILVSETIGDVLGKLAKHPDQSATRAEAANIMQALSKRLASHLTGLEYQPFFYNSRGERLTGTQLVDKMLTYLRAARTNELAAETELGVTGRAPNISARQAYQSAAAVVLRMNKLGNPAWVDAEHIDHHNHPGDGYDKRGNYSKVSPLQWNARQQKSLKVSSADGMQIPHEINGLSDDSRTTREGYYEDLEGTPPTKVTTRFYSYENTILEQRKALDAAVLEIINHCNTGIPVDPARLNEVRELAQEYGRVATTAQLEEGRKLIAVDFGEITGYKPAVPQDMLGAGQLTQNGIRNAFRTGSRDVLTAIFTSAQDGAAAATRAYAEGEDGKPGKDVNGVKIKVRIVYHSDAQPTVATSQKPANQGATGLKEATVMSDLDQIYEAVDQNLTAHKATLKLPKGVECNPVLQSGHLNGTSVSNYAEIDRTTELHRTFNNTRQKLQTLRVTSDASWLTASARNINVGMASFLGTSADPELRRLGELIKSADDLSNNGFMFLHGGERFFEIDLLNGNHSDDTILDMAYMRAAQKKAVTAYHSLLGEINDMFDTNPALRDTLRTHVESGFYTTGANQGLVLPGNYPGLFFKLADPGHLDTNTWEGVSGKVDTGIQDQTPIVWGTDNLTPGEARSGDLKMLQYVSQHAPLEILLGQLSRTGTAAPTINSTTSTYHKVLRNFQVGPNEDPRYRGTRATLDTTNIYDGNRPTASGRRGERAKPEAPDPIAHTLRAGQDAVRPWAQGKERTIHFSDEPPAMKPPAPTTGPSGSTS